MSGLAIRPKWVYLLWAFGGLLSTYGGVQFTLAAVYFWSGVDPVVWASQRLLWIDPTDFVEPRLYRQDRLVLYVACIALGQALILKSRGVKRVRWR